MGRRTQNKGLFEMKDWLKQLFVAASIAVLTSGAAATETKVIVGYASPNTPASASRAFGLKLGFFREEGLVPQFVSVQGSAVLVPQVANKQIIMALPNPDLLVLALAKGEPYPVKFVSSVFPSQIFEFVVLENSSVKTLSDLRGRKLGVGGLTWGNLPMSRVMLADAGVKWQEDVQVLPVGLGPAAWKRLQSGDVDALNLFSMHHQQMVLAGTPIRRLPMPDKFEKVFSNGFVVHEDDIKERPQVIVGLLRAMAKSAIACRANTVACVKSYWEFDPATRPAPDKEAAWIAANVRLNEVELALILDGFASKKIGYFPPETWQALLQVMKLGGQIASVDLDVSKLYTNDFIKAANEFDVDAVIAKAKAAH